MPMMGKKLYTVYIKDKVDFKKMHLNKRRGSIHQGHFARTFGHSAAASTGAPTRWPWRGFEQSLLWKESCFFFGSRIHVAPKSTKPQHQSPSVIQLHWHRTSLASQVLTMPGQLPATAPHSVWPVACHHPPRHQWPHNAWRSLEGFHHEDNAIPTKCNEAKPRKVNQSKLCDLPPESGPPKWKFWHKFNKSDVKVMIFFWKRKTTLWPCVKVVTKCFQNLSSQALSNKLKTSSLGWWIVASTVFWVAVPSPLAKPCNNLVTLSLGISGRNLATNSYACFVNWCFSSTCSG